jgi:hypothetical protein
MVTEAQELNAAIFRAGIGLGDAATKDVGLNAETVAPGDVVGGDVAAHVASHENGGSAEISVAGLSGVLADAQTPATHASSHENAGGDEISVTGLSGLLADSQTPLGHHASHEPGGSDVILGLHRSLSITYISGTGTAGVDNTAQTVKSLSLAANTLTQVGDRMRIRCYWTGDTGTPITGSTLIGPAGSEVLVAHTTDSGAATLQVNEVWLHYIDATHANIIENEAGALGALSAPNVAGFGWNGAQNILFTQDAIANNHTILYALIVDVLPKGAS